MIHQRMDPVGASSASKLLFHAGNEKLGCGDAIGLLLPGGLRRNPERRTRELHTFAPRMVYHFRHGRFAPFFRQEIDARQFLSERPDMKVALNLPHASAGWQSEPKLYLSAETVEENPALGAKHKPLPPRARIASSGSATPSTTGSSAATSPARSSPMPATR